MQRRSQNEAEEVMRPPKQTCKDFSLVLFINVQLFENKRKE